MGICQEKFAAAYQSEALNKKTSYAPLARLEGIRMFLALSCHNNFKLYKMDVKSTFLNGKIEE